MSVHLAVFIHFTLAAAVGQQESITADQVISKYRDAIGAERFPTIKTFMERGETAQSGKDHVTFEYYFKSPNLRFSSTLGGNNTVITLHGCDGKVSWYIDGRLKRSEFKPKPGSEYDCVEGLEPMPSFLRNAKVKMRLIKKKTVEGRPAWEIKADNPNSQ